MTMPSSLSSSSLSSLSSSLPNVTGGLSLRERLSGLAARQLQSRAFLFLYLLMVTSSIIVLLWALVVPCPAPAFHRVDGVVTLFLAYDVFLRFLAAPAGTYLRRSSNIFDVFVVVICVPLFFVSAGCSPDHQIERVGDAVVRGLRNVIQGFRLFLILKKNRQKLQERETVINLPPTHFSHQSIRLEDIRLDALHSDPNDSDGNFEFHVASHSDLEDPRGKS